MLAAVLPLAGCTGAPTNGDGDPSAPGSTSTPPSASPTAAVCSSGVSSATRVEFITPYIEQERAYDGGLAGAWLAKEHWFRSWTDMRIIAHRDMAWTGEEGFEVVTVDATNGTATWLFTLRYELVSRCVDDRAVDDARSCTHWGDAANDTRAAFESAGSWSSNFGGECRTSGGA